MHSIVKNTKNLKIAYYHRAASFQNRNAAGVIFLPGFKSDMQGSKALFLEEKCKESGLSYTRFDYSGHGESEGNFAKLTLSDWLADTMLILDEVAKKPQIVVGSSMGGWLALRLCMERPEQIKGFIGIAAAPDFTEEVEARMTSAHRQQMAEKGYFEEPNDYSDEPYVFSQALIVDGARHNILKAPIPYTGPVHLLQGKQDADVPWQKAVRIQECLAPTNAKITFIEDGNHSLSRPEDLDILWNAVTDMEDQLNKADSNAA